MSEATQQDFTQQLDYTAGVTDSFSNAATQPIDVTAGTSLMDTDGKVSFKYIYIYI